MHQSGIVVIDHIPLSVKCRCNLHSQDREFDAGAASHFTQPAQLFAPFKGPLRTLQPMKSIPKVKRPVGRPRKQPREDPDTQTQPNDGGDGLSLSTT